MVHIFPHHADRIPKIFIGPDEAHMRWLYLRVSPFAVMDITQRSNHHVTLLGRSRVPLVFIGKLLRPTIRAGSLSSRWPEHLEGDDTRVDLVALTKTDKPGRQAEPVVR